MRTAPGVLRAVVRHAGTRRSGMQLPVPVPDLLVTPLGFSEMRSGGNRTRSAARTEHIARRSCDG